MDFSVTEFVGIVGAALMLVAFVLLQLKYLKDDDLVYDGINFVGGLLLVAYAHLIGSLPFLILNGVWTLVSLRDIVLYSRQKFTTDQK